MEPPQPSVRFVVLVPVKAPAVGKSRLRVPDHLRPGLAAAFALDAVGAARACEAVVEVVVVTDDPGFRRECDRRGVATLPDRDDLNGSLVAAATALRGRHPDATPVALLSDLPALRPADLDQALAQVADEGPWFVADADGSGTTTYVAAYDRFDPRFGPGSCEAHLRAGARELVGELPTLRRDVDDEVGLADAVRMGVGPHTRDAVALLG